jgi:hypothetical protein
MCEESKIKGSELPKQGEEEEEVTTQMRRRIWSAEVFS